MITTSEYRTDNGISREWLAEYAGRLIWMVANGEQVPGFLPDKGMQAVAADAILLDCSSDAERKDFTVAELAQRFRDRYYSAHGMETEAVSPRGEMIGWEAVSRWLTFAIQAEDEEGAAEALNLIYQKARQEYLSVDTNAATHPRPQPRAAEAKARSAADILRDEQLALERAESGDGFTSAAFDGDGGVVVTEYTDPPGYDDEPDPLSEFAYTYGQPEPDGADDHEEPGSDSAD